MSSHPFARAVALALVSVTALSVHADETTTTPVIVTATRTAQTADETLAAVTVITREDIERQQAQSLPDLLASTAGIAMTNDGGLGKNTSVFLRGSNSGHVLVLVDGVKLGSATLGTTAFQDIPVDQIERIEIVRGPRSSLYGSEAIGGVIQIFTRRGDGPARPFFSVTAGSYRTLAGTVGVSGGDKNQWFSASASGLASDGFNSTTTGNADKDGYRNIAGSLRAGVRLAPQTELEGFALSTRGHNEFDGWFADSSQTQQIVTGARLRSAINDRWQASLQAARSTDEIDSFASKVFVDRFRTTRDSVSFQNDLTLTKQQLLSIGADHQNDRIDSSTVYSVTERSNLGIFAQHQAILGDHSLQMSLRRDDNEQFGKHDTGGIAWGYRLNSTLRSNVSFGTAFKAPTFNDLYYTGVGGQGNPALQPETAQSWEIGLTGTPGALRWDLRAFRTRVENLIAWQCAVNCADADFMNDIWQPFNTSQARIDGLEFTAAFAALGWKHKLDLTLMRPVDEATGNRLARRADQSGRLELDRPVGPVEIGFTLRAEGLRYNNSANTQKLAPYALVDARAGYAFNRDWQIQARVVNLFDEDYETSTGYYQPGRSYYVTLRYQPARQ